MSQLTKNTTDLDALIAKANALPDAGTSEDLTAVLDAQETLISELEAELEGKAAGGGGAVETCTVTVTQESSVLDDILAIRLLNGTIITELCYAGNVSTITDVVVGTTISIVCVTNVYIYTSGGITYFYDDGFDGKVSFYTVTGDGTITIQKATNN